MSQLTLSEAEFDKYRKVTRREQFLAEMDRTLPWAALCARIAPVYPAPQGPGRRQGFLRQQIERLRAQP